MRLATSLPLVLVVLTLGSGCKGGDADKDEAGPKPKQEAPPPPDFSNEPAAAELAELIERGEEAYLDHACDSCHAVDGASGARGPSFVGLYGTRARFADKSEVERDEAYLYESIVDPKARLIEGWAESPMPITPMERDEVVGLVYYIRSLEHATIDDD